MDQRSPHEWYELASQLLKEELLDEALSAIDHAIAQNEYEPSYWTMSAQILLALGRAQSALLASQKALAFTPRSGEALRLRDEAIMALDRNRV